ncbi:Oidioi.mRNA.OKI2018_I69.chr1.g1922.t1.cds [Oikopleura dioica]|uniref:Hexosyltransferase n=1 Tax=Oikopleura dioica TaxID=34765 RepID=A0ABN7SPG8_OIKDI|nr:Oidioi.mRNA.OKI2018_I69.chr1.g1922.t1.cds [Oikopleura dioica]
MRKEERQRRRQRQLQYSCLIVLIIIVYSFESTKSREEPIVAEKISYQKIYPKKEPQEKPKEKWKLLKNHFIHNCAFDNCKKHSSLKSSQKLCEENDDCMGVVGINDYFELRRGPSIIKSSQNETSWLIQREECFPEEDEIFLDLELLEQNYPELKGIKRRGLDGKCVYPGLPYINKLMRFNPNLKPKLLAHPENCQFDPSSNLTSLLFGIKTMPDAVVARETLRKTWLNEEIWNWLGIEIKIVFIIGRPDEEVIKDEIKTYNDLLVLDFEENHYGLPYKDIGFLQFIEKSCQKADFVFKGDDDILLLPQNLKMEMNKLKRENGIFYEAIGCLKERPTPIREFSKYFMPKQLWEKDVYPQYFSGAGYLTTGDFALSLAKEISNAPVLPLDDVYIGSLIEAAGKRDTLLRSESICCGLIWAEEAIAKNHLCSLRGLTVAHKFKDYQHLEWAYHDLVSGNFECDIEGDGVSFGGLYRDAWKEGIKNFIIYPKS